MPRIHSWDFDTDFNPPNLGMDILIDLKKTLLITI